MHQRHAREDQPVTSSLYTAAPRSSVISSRRTQPVGRALCLALLLTACNDGPASLPSYHGSARITTTTATGAKNVRVADVSLTNTTTSGSYVVASVPVGPNGATVRFIVSEPMATGAANSSSMSASSSSGTIVGGADLVATTASSAAGDAQHPWAKLDTGGGSLRVKRAVNGIILEIANIKVATGDTSFVVSRNSWFDGTALRSDYFVSRNKQGEQVIYDFRNVFTAVEQLQDDRKASYVVSLMSVALAKCTRTAVALLSPTALSAQAPAPAPPPCDLGALRTAADRASTLRDYAVGGFGTVVFGGIIGTVTTAGLGSLVAASAIVGGGFGMLAAQAQYNWAQDDVYRCANGGEEPPRCSGPTIGSCKRFK